MPATFIGWKRGARRGLEESGNKTTEDIAIVRGAASIADAILASGVPRYGTPLTEDPSQLVRRFTPQEHDEEGTFLIGVVWQTPNTGSFNNARTFQGAEWTHSLVSQRVTIDLDGEPIGSRHYCQIVAPSAFSKLIHEGAQLGTDIQVPFSQVEICMPIPGNYPAGLVHTLIGKVNGSNMMLDGVQFAPGEVILMGARAVRLEPQPFNNYDIRYLFAVGRSELPERLEAWYAVDNEVYGQATIPLKFGYSVIYAPYTEDGAAAGNQSEIAESRPDHVLVHRLFKDGNLGQLGVT